MRRIVPPLALAFLVALAAAPLSTTAAGAQSVGTFATGLTSVYALAFDGAGNLYVARRTPVGVITKCTPPSNVMSLVAGGFSDPVGVLPDASGNVFVADYNYGAAGGRVARISPALTVTTFATVPNPTCLAFDTNGDLFVGRWDGVINRVTPAGTVTVHADLKTVSYLGVLGVNNHVTALHRDADGTLYAGVRWGAIFTVSPGGAITPHSRLMLGCQGLTKAGDGMFYGASYIYNEIWRFSAAGTGAVYAGKSNVAGFTNGPLLDARFNDPAGLAVAFDKLYVADYGNSAIRSADLPLATPATNSSWGRLKALYR